MKGQEKITFDELKNLKQKFDQWIETFDIDNYQDLQKIIKKIEDEIEFLFMVSEDRYKERLTKRALNNEKIAIENKESKSKIIQENWNKYKEAKVKEIFIDHQDWRFTQRWSSTKKFKEKDFLDWFKAKEFIESDKYNEIIPDLLIKSKSFIDQLKYTLEDTKSRTKDIFQNYDNLAQLFLKLWIQPQIRDYDFFSKWTWTPREKSDTPKINKIDKETPEFKKVWYIFKYLQDNKITFNPRHILRYPDWNLYIYLQTKNITIIVSDEITWNNCFRDATYIVKWPILENEPITKEMIWEYEGKRIMFTENRTDRIQDILEQNPDNREKIKTQNWIHEDEIGKELITNKNEFIKTIKENFTIDSLNWASYIEFINKYNLDPKNIFLFRSTLVSNYAILWLPRNSSIKTIKNEIRWISDISEKNDKSNFLWNDTIKSELEKLRSYSDFNPEKNLWNASYSYWLSNILKIAFDNKDSNFIYSLPINEKQEKIRTLTGINLPLTAETLSMRLGWIYSSVKKYQLKLRERFCLYIDWKQDSKKYIDLCLEIQELEKRSPSVHSKSTKKVKDSIQTVNDEILTSFDIPEPTKVEEKNNLTIDNLTKFWIYKWKIVQINSEKIHIKLDNSEIIWRSLNYSFNYSVWDSVDVIITDIKQNSKNNSNYPLLSIRRFEWQEKVLEFCDWKTFWQDELLKWFCYRWVINNIKWNRIRVSLSKNCSGVLELDWRMRIKIWKQINIKFKNIVWGIPVFEVIRKTYL